MAELTTPSDLNWQEWVARWERMQDRYLVARAERFAVIVRTVRDTLPAKVRILDLGCGPGSLMAELLESLPGVEVIGVDLDPALLLLGELRLGQFGNRVHFVKADLRQPAWVESVSAPFNAISPFDAASQSGAASQSDAASQFDAIVSATALHWLPPERLSALYGQLAPLLRPGGLFMNADHVASEFPPVQKAWDKHRAEMRAQQGLDHVDDWNGFWRAYGAALKIGLGELRTQLDGAMIGSVEEGLPLAWHFHALKAGGFHYVDCFWRNDGDAIYGGIRGDSHR